MNTKLFIENREIELTDDVQFAITKQFEELSNPTTIINDWSKTVSIPFTSTNNEIFGHIYNPDKLTVEGNANQTLTGIYFNPYKKLDMRLQWGDDVLMVGYAKMNEVKQNDGKGVYNITLFGQLGKLFQEMQKITFDKTVNDTSYLIDGAKYVDNYIDRTLVYNSWNSTGQTHSELLEKTDSGYTVTDIIGFAPNNSFNEGFDYKTLQTGINSSQSLVEILGNSFTADTGVEPATAIPNGLMAREYGEYRSYLQLPFIYWNKLFQVFQNKVETLTNYQFELDSDWFNTNNPYWYNLVYMLKPFDLKSEETITNLYMWATQGIPGWGGEISAYTQDKIYDVAFPTKNEVIPIIDSNNYIQLSDDYTVVFYSIYTIKLDISNYTDLRINPNNGLEFSFRVKSVNDTVLDEYKWLMVDNDYSGNTNGYVEVLRLGRTATGGFYAYPKLNIMLNKGKYGEKVKLEFKAVWLNSNAPFYDINNNPFMPSPSQYFGYINLYLYNAPINQPITCYVNKGRKRSYNHFTLNDLWDNEHNLFSEMLKYCKMYRIGISVDEFEKKIIFKPFHKYFETYSVEDWTGKIDKSKDFTITPVTFENKYVLFNYKDSDSKLGKEYKEKYGVNYGDYRLVTDYNFNSETKSLFDGVSPSITNSDSVLSWTNLLNNHKIIYSLPSEISVYNKDKDNKQVNIFGSFYFHNGLTNFSTEMSLFLRDVYLTDDTAFQGANNTYFYIQDELEVDEKIQVFTYPKLDIVKDDNMCVFNVPKENYTYLNNYSGKSTIYTNLWEKYINERYNIQNKKITCYVDLKPHEYNQFKFNQLVKIGNQLCIVNKIYDYDITANNTTKVDLVTIQDINGYTTNNYNS